MLAVERLLLAAKLTFSEQPESGYQRNDWIYEMLDGPQRFHDSVNFRAINRNWHGTENFAQAGGSIICTYACRRWRLAYRFTGLIESVLCQNIWQKSRRRLAKGEPRV